MDDVIEELWYCPKCIQAILAYNNIDDDDVFLATIQEGIVNDSYRLLSSDNMFMPFEINDKIPFNEIDPDFQYFNDSYYINITNCDYYLEKTFNDQFEKYSDLQDKFSLFHMNIKSLPKYHSELETYLDSLCIKFSIIGHTETWLDENKEALYDIPEYTCINRFRSNRKGGGVTLAVKNGIPYKMRADLEYFDTEMEWLFIEIDKHVFDTTSDLVIGIIYRMPNSSIDIFNDRLNDILNIIYRERKICYFLGDLNIDLLKYEEHRPTSEFLDLIYSYNVFPLISKPTRITSNTATLIDHILTNNFQYHSKQF